jgi:hypothetical protein
MQSMRKISILLMVLVCLNFTAKAAFACMCFGSNNAKTMRDAAAWFSAGAHASKFIFEGSVTKQEVRSGSIGMPATAVSMTTQGQYRAVSVHVVHVYRGEAGADVTVMTGMGGGDCGFDFDTGKSYLIYAAKTGPNTFSTNMCTGTSAMEDAGAELRFLRGEAPTADDLMDRYAYYLKYQPQRTGTICGRVSKADGSPFAKAQVDVTQIREESLFPRTASDPALSKPDGSFCIRGIYPGRYVLTAETLDYDHDLRWMAYYPGVALRSEATVLEVKAGDNLKGMNFKASQVSVYTVSFRIEASDGTPLPVEALGVMIDPGYRDELAYHLQQQRMNDGWFTMGYVPPGHYFVETYLQYGASAQAREQLSKWRMAKQEVDIKADTDIVLKLEPAN